MIGKMICIPLEPIDPTKLIIKTKKGIITVIAAIKIDIKLLNKIYFILLSL